MVNVAPPERPQMRFCAPLTVPDVLWIAVGQMLELPGVST
jgi:hypothetical protein